jgi:hypothetical protein
MSSFLYCASCGQFPSRKATLVTGRRKKKRKRKLRTVGFDVQHLSKSATSLLKISINATIPHKFE